MCRLMISTLLCRSYSTFPHASIAGAVMSTSSDALLPCEQRFGGASSSAELVSKASRSCAGGSSLCAKKIAKGSRRSADRASQSLGLIPSRRTSMNLAS